MKVQVAVAEVTLVDFFGAELFETSSTSYLGGYGGGGGSYVDSTVTSSSIDIANVVDDGEITITFISP